MSGFLANLAALASGSPQAGAARLALPPRFAASNTVEPVVEDMATTAQPADARQDMPATGTRTTTGDDPLPRPHEQAPRVEQASRPAADLPTPPQRPAPPVSKRHVVAETSARRPAFFELDIGERPEASLVQPVTTPTFRSQEDRSVEVGAPQPRVLPERAPAMHPAPLSEAAVAGRASVERDVRPIVHVTIDRIDVRAPREAPKAEPAPRRAKPPSSVSLADYLKVRS